MEIVSIRLDNLKGLDYFGKVLNENRSEIVRSLVEEGKKMKAINLYKERKVSLGLAATLAGIGLGEFIDLLEEYKVKLNLTMDDARLAMENAERIL